jgi:uncharacterized protein (DUF1501 family)
MERCWRFKKASASWKETAIVIITEFGRTAKVNGTIGTDHGTGTVTFLVGGAIKGPRVADWSGLKEAQWHEKRDLKPTTDLRAVRRPSRPAGRAARHAGVPRVLQGGSTEGTNCVGLSRAMGRPLGWRDIIWWIRRRNRDRG